MFRNFIFSYYFYGTFDLRLPMHSNSYLSKASFTKDFAYFVPVFYVFNFFEAPKIFKIQNALKLLFTWEHAVLGWVFDWIAPKRISLQTKATWFMFSIWRRQNNRIWIFIFRRHAYWKLRILIRLGKSTVFTVPILKITHFYIYF